MPRRISVVVSQSQSKHPAKRKVEEDLVAGLLGERGIDVTVIPHLYDLAPDGTGMLCLQGIATDIIVCSWLFPRAAHWTLDRNQVRGRIGATLLKALGEDAEDADEDAESDDDETTDEQAEAGDKLRALDQRPTPARTIWCLDLRAYPTAEPYLGEIRRIAAEATIETVALSAWISGAPQPQQLARYLAPADSNGHGNGHAAGPIKAAADQAAAGQTAGPLPLQIVGDEPDRRWYPVIDFSRCTNCMECIDSCLFGVYGVDAAETILVEQPDNCRKGCPACSRVCPENAIIFPQHKTPTIAGSAETAGALKIDLSQLFGAPDPGEPGAAEAVNVAVRERDEQLLLAGRQAVGATIGVPKRQAAKSTEPKDDLDSLMDKLDELDL